MYRLIKTVILITLLFSSQLLWSMELAHLERLIEEHALKNDAEMAPAEIKKIARYLDAKHNPDFYAETIQKFLAGDKLAKPKKGLILFVGSSSIRLWNTLADDMSPMQVINRGFGGAYIRHINYHFDDVVSRYKPRAVVFFCGTNDIAGLHSPESVFADFLRFYAMSREALPQTKIFVIGIKPTVSRAYLRKEEQDFNARIASLAGTEKGLFYIDIWDSMLNSDGSANPALFIEDGLHLNAAGYALWKRLTKPILEANL